MPFRTSMTPKARLAVQSIGTAEIVEWLSRASTYPEQPASVEGVETHISWVFLTNRFAYKLKKPVAFEFLDFSRPELRRAMCEREVVLNRRWAPGVYQGVVPITVNGQGRLHLGGAGMPIEWLVKMRRLPAARALDVLLRNQTVTAGEVNQLADVLADLFHRLPPVTLRVNEYREAIEQHVRANRRELLAAEHQLPTAAVASVHAAQLRLLRLAPELLDHRAGDGRIVEGHGDLRPEHVYLLTGPKIIDCIEFNDEFRRLDVLDELSFLAMECEKLGAPAIGAEVIRRYARQSGDRPPWPLLNFYKCYRACVRAKVAVLRAEQHQAATRAADLDEAQRYLELAGGYARDLGAPLLLVVRGLMGTGKSTLATAIKDTLGMEILETDSIRRELFGPSHQPAAYNDQLYQPHLKLRVYDDLLHRADRLLADRVSVVLDGTFLQQEPLMQAAELAKRHGAEFMIVQCTCPDDVAKERIAERNLVGRSLSEARPELYDLQRREDAALPAEMSVCTVDTTGGLPEMTAAVCQRLREDTSYGSLFFLSPRVQ